MRRTLGTAVFSGMLGVTLFGIFLTPVFFYVIDWLGEPPGVPLADRCESSAASCLVVFTLRRWCCRPLRDLQSPLAARQG